MSTLKKRTRLADVATATLAGAAATLGFDAPSPPPRNREQRRAEKRTGRCSLCGERHSWPRRAVR